ncbi:hypothetical protein ACA910_013720 [Epithemia clementina (nom. ined.)]
MHCGCYDYCSCQNLDSILYYVGLSLLIGSLNDSGLPQAAWQWILNFYESYYGDLDNDSSVGGYWTCAEYLFGSPLCLLYSNLVFFLASAVVGPWSTILAFAAAFPFASSYEWIQLAFATSMGSMVWTPFRAASVAGRDVSNGFDAIMALLFHNDASCGRLLSYCSGGLVGVFLLVVFFAVASLFLGAFLLSRFHWVPACSVRLGDCV